MGKREEEEGRRWMMHKVAERRLAAAVSDFEWEWPKRRTRGGKERGGGRDTAGRKVSFLVVLPWPAHILSLVVVCRYSRPFGEASSSLSEKKK